LQKHSWEYKETDTTKTDSFTLAYDMSGVFKK